jgi:adenosylmethionine-8-amino-7-oxononanoate aminotransferase
VRQCGTILALDYEVEGAGYLSALQPRLLAFFREAGVLIRPLGNTAYLMPPYCISARIWRGAIGLWQRRRFRPWF